MRLEFKSKIASEIQTLHIPNKIATLIGENGSGKSSILEAIFEKYIDNGEYKIIAFSSGQNELFTTLFDKHKKESNRYLAQSNEIIHSFYFNPDWLKLLVFWATVLEPNGKVRSYLLNGNYIKLNEFGDDISSKLHFKFRIRKAYVERIRKEVANEKYGVEGEDGYNFEENLYRKTYFHEALEKIIDVFEIDFDFLNMDNLVKRSLILDSDKAFKIFMHKDIEKIFSFWALATHGWLANVDWSDFSLKFKNDLDFHNLSDGEYQLLSLYALMDLFDGSNTIFLLDEADSHLYYKNLLLMWRVLHEAEGTILSTTHISDSILQNEFKNIRLVDKGMVEKNTPFRELSKRLNSVIGDKSYQYKILSRVELPVLIDNINDWDIFRKLAIKKIGKKVIPTLDKFLPLSVSSSFDSIDEVFGKGKLNFIKEFKERNLGNETLTKEIFLLCDKDELPENQIRENLTVNINREFNDIKKFNSNKTRTHLLSLKRREIENYLLSPSLFEAKECKEEINKLYNFPEYDIGDNLDNITDFRNGEFKAVVKPLYNDSNGFNEDMLDEVISIIPKEEISEDIVTIYNYLKNKIQ